MNKELKRNTPEEEEDLEALRIAALSSLKKKNEMNGFIQNKQFNHDSNYKNKGYRVGKRRYYPGQTNRNIRNGQFNQIRKSNLISILTVTDDKDESIQQTNVKSIKNDDDLPKLIRPQDRYASINKEQIENESSSSKFDRYDNSHSESEDDEDLTNKLTKSNSLEALMEELDAEIQGETKKESVPSEEINNDEEKVQIHDVPLKDENKIENVKVTQKIYKQKSPGRKKMLNNRRMNGRIFNNDPNFIPNNQILIQNPPFINHQVPQTQFNVYNNPLPHQFDNYSHLQPVQPQPSTNFIPTHILPHPYVPLQQPLLIDTSNNSSIPLGSLSPRSAAFVLQNRAIVEKRKRSPNRRSYSRSPSPHRFSPPNKRFSPIRRSLTPKKRSLSPLRRSISPRRRSLSPYQKYSPKKLKESPKRNSPKRSRDTRKPPIKNRLGARKNEEEIKKKEETSPIVKPDEKSFDPILEARKRKFETSEIKVKEGVIRLKPKDDEKKQKIDEEKVIKEEIDTLPTTTTSTRIVLLPKNEEKDEPKDQLEEAMNELEMLLKDEDSLELSAKIDELFTDDETDQENEGRFKTRKASMTSDKPFVKKINGSTSLKRKDKPKWNNIDDKKDSKKKIKEPLTNPIENRKIEIKIRNPSKYEKVQQSTTSSIRKIELIEKKNDSGDDESEPEMIVENEEDKVEKDDLRAQLSRKRAERQKLPIVEGISSRLLQNALEGVVFKRKKSKKKEKDLMKDKLPIHLRLGIAKDSDLIAEETSSSSSTTTTTTTTEKLKKKKKRRHTSLEQV